MTDSVRPAPDLFDEAAPAGPAGAVRAISPLTRSTPEAEPDPVPLYWSRAVVAGAIGIVAGIVSNFPSWGIAVLGLAIAPMYLRDLPPLIKRVWLILVVSFFFAQCTTIFVGTPFTWVMRFLFCATLLGALTYVRVSGDD
ncbi:MAG TPA: hypothetical protein VGO39_12630 [Gaiellaceae bacterium]|nr:hypothetical protein [Gaiellaceae bacterium]